MGTAAPSWPGISDPHPLLPSFFWTRLGAVLGCDLPAGPVPQPGHPDYPSLSPAEVSHPWQLLPASTPWCPCTQAKQPHAAHPPFSVGGSEARCRSGCPLATTHGSTKPAGLLLGTVEMLWSGSWLGTSFWRERHSFLPTTSIPPFVASAVHARLLSNPPRSGASCDRPPHLLWKFFISMCIISASSFVGCQPGAGFPLHPGLPTACGKSWPCTCLSRRDGGCRMMAPAWGNPPHAWDGCGVCPSTDHAGGIDFPKEERRDGCMQSCARPPRPSQL